MPTYEYKCGACGHAFEAFQSIKADPLRDCPECKRTDSVKRLISAGAGFIFKGSGFYITDYRSESYKQAAKNDSAPAAAAAASTPASAPAGSSTAPAPAGAPAPAAKAESSSGASSSSAGSSPKPTA